ncbi:hypothetical protein [Mumia sp. DW29H23]|uniref:O-antigen polymerase n=1 Tax=Mumia sp. DW29H23 TaxID=3421241 RepID=UPI003D691B13
MTESRVVDREVAAQRGVAADLAALTCLVAAALVLLLFQQRDAQVAPAYVALAATPVVWLLFKGSVGGGSVVRWLLTPAGLLVTFLWVAVLVPPFAWALGLATPWETFPRAQTTWVVATAIGLVALVHLGACIRARPARAVAPLEASGGLAAVLVGVLGVLVAAATILSETTGGLGYLLGNLLERRDLLTGAGPLNAVAATAGAAVVASCQVRMATRAQVVLAAACAAAYLGFLFVLGSRFTMLAFVLAVVIARTIVGRVPKVLLAVLVVAIVPFSLWYSVSIRRGQLVEPGTAGVRSELRSAVDPFISTGLDVLNTHAAVITSPTATWRFDVDLIARNLTTMVPRSLWPGKPQAFSVEFSERFFPVQWARGSGWPPSVLAESVYVYGVAGAVLVLVALGFVVAWLGRRMSDSRHVVVRLFYPFLAVDCIGLAKSGSDAFLQQISIHAVGIGLFLVLCSLVRVRLAVSDG